MRRKEEESRKTNEKRLKRKYKEQQEQTIKYACRRKGGNEVGQELKESK